MRNPRVAFLAGLGVALFGARAPGLEHVVQAGESLAQIAVNFYGAADRAALLVEANALPGLEAPLPPGTRLVVPAADFLRVEHGDTWESLAARYVGDARHGYLLSTWNGVRDRRRAPEEGAVVRIPFVLRHTAGLREDLDALAVRYLGGRDRGRMLEVFNGLRGRRLAEGQVVLLPLVDLQLSASGREADERERSRRAPARAAEAQPRINDQIRVLEGMNRDGRYAELVAGTSRLLAAPDLTGNQAVTIEKLLAFGYVALGEDALAVAAFREALRRQPDLELNPITTSPKVLRVFRDAHAPAPAPPAAAPPNPTARP